MKKFATTFLTIFAFLSTQAQVDYVIISGKIENPKLGDKVRIYDAVSSKSIYLEVSAEGTFRHTLYLEKPTMYSISYDKFFSLYLEKGMDVYVTFDAKNLKPTLNYEGKGSVENKFLLQKEKISSVLFNQEYKVLFALDKATFSGKLDKYNQEFTALLESNKGNLGAEFIELQKKAVEEFTKGMNMENSKLLLMNEKLTIGKPSPLFKNYESNKGKKMALSDFQGKYVFIDVWATWCGPCKYEIPYLKELEQKYHGKNITFLSISVDRQKDKEKWKKMILKEGLGGIQLLADKEIESQFIKDYFIEGIPRFILLDPKGNIISYDTPRPSEPELITLFTENGI